MTSSTLSEIDRPRRGVKVLPYIDPVAELTDRVISLERWKRRRQWMQFVLWLVVIVQQFVMLYLTRKFFKF